MVWNQHHNGVFKSVDGGSNWTEITERPPSVFGFAVAAHPTDPDVAWFVPAIKDEMRVPVDGRLVVSRTTDGGKSRSRCSATACRRSTPTTSCTATRSRPTRSGDDLAMGSTTGSLWASDNAGEHWTTVAANLPPIYFTRFAA